MTVLQPDCQLWTFTKMDEYLRVGFFFPFFFSFKRRLVVSEDKTCGGPLSTMEPIV